MDPKAIEFDPGAAIDAHRSLMATLNSKFWERCKTRKTWRGGKAAMYEEDEFKHLVSQAQLVPDTGIAAKELYIAVADMLLSPTTILPIDSSTLHKKLAKLHRRGKYTELLDSLGQVNIDWVLVRMAQQAYIELAHFELDQRLRLMVVAAARPMLCQLAGKRDPLEVRQQVRAQPVMAQPAQPVVPVVQEPVMPAMRPAMVAPQAMMGAMMMQGGPGMAAMRGAVGPQGLPLAAAAAMGVGPMGPAGMIGHGHMGGHMGPAGMGMMPAHMHAFGGHMGDFGGGGGFDGDMGRPLKRLRGDGSVDDLLQHQSVRDKIKAEKGEELHELLARPSAKQSAALEQFKSAGGPAIHEQCPHLTKEQCRRAHNSYLACHRMHFRRLIRPWTDVSLGNCQYLDSCRSMATCRHVHYEREPQPDAMTPEVAHMMAMRQQVPAYLQALEEPQWINCDVRSFDMRVLGKFGVIMADPPWEIRMDLPYGTMTDDEMRGLDIGCLQDEGVIFLWVTARAMELGRECLELWGYRRVDELIWVKTNQLTQLARTGRTGHWLNHSKEHCLVGVKGNPPLNRFVDCDVVLGEVRETSRKPDEMYSLLERLSPGTRKLEVFARPHNLQRGWVGLGNQLPGTCVKDPELRARLEQRYGPLESAKLV